MTIPHYITEGLRFAPEGSLCRPVTGMGREFKCNYEGQGPAYAIHTWKGRNLCAYHSPFDNKYVPCCLCGMKPALREDDPEIDPVCEDCTKGLEEQAAQAPTYEFNNDEGGCPGWNDSCGNTLEGDADLCPDCTMGRMNEQSPRIGTDTRRPSGEALLGFDGENTHGGGYYG